LAQQARDRQNLFDGYLKLFIYHPPVFMLYNGITKLVFGTIYKQHGRHQVTPYCLKMTH